MAQSNKNEGNVNIPANYVVLKGSERRVRKGAQRTGPADPKEIVNVTICVRRRPGAPPLPTQDYWAKTPPGRRKYLSQEDFATKYGAAQAELDKVAAFARSNGLTVASTNTGQRTVLVSGTVEQMNKAFAVDLGMYESGTEKYRGREGAVHLPNEIAAVVEGVFGLDNRRMARRSSNGFTPTSPITPIQVAKDYNFPTGNAPHQTIGVFEFSDPVLGDCGFVQSDVNDYFTTNLAGVGPGLITPTVTPVTANGVGNSPGGLNDDEVMIDICVAAAVAQQAAINVYFATFDENGWVLIIKEAVNPTHGETKPSVVSISWQFPEFESIGNLNWTAMAMNQVDATLQEAAAAGITVFTAAGDLGSDCGVGDGNAHVNYPYSDPWITCCGGTEIGTENGSYAEVTWPDTGGGISANFPLPAWQQGIGVPASVNPPHNAGRGIPDICGYANGYTIVLGGSAVGPLEGTSETAPLYAGLIALINEQIGEPVGYLNPILYAFAADPATAGIFRGIDDGVSNAQNGAPGYTAGPGPGWNACNGLGVIDGSALLGALQTLYQKNLTFIMQRSTFGQNEVAATGGVFTQAFFVIVDGLTPSDFPNGPINTLTPNPTQLKNWAPVIPDPVGPAGATNITITPSAVSSDDPSLSPEVQRFTFTYTVTFPDQSAFTTPPPSDFPEVLTITASLAATTGGLSASSQIELITAADPYFSSESNGGLYWLSEDIRTFYAEEGSTLFGAPPLGSAPADALSFIQWVIANISGPHGVGPNGDSFETTLSPNEESSAISLLPVTLLLPTKNIYNFAIARVRLNGTSAAQEAKKVRAFFRLFQSQSVAVPYQTPLSPTGVSAPTGAYRQWSDGIADGQKTPLLGISSDSSEYITVPCFASPRVPNTTTTNNMTTQTDPPNTLTIVPIAGQTVYTYFGCWLDNNQSAKIFPLAPGADPDGPFTGTLNTVSQVLDRGGHQCLIVELVDDEAPIIDNATPGSSDKIAQRNLAFSIVANPGLQDSRLATHTFEIRPSPTTFNVDQVPDELMIDWGNVPHGSVASIYLPAVRASDVLDLANRMYTIHNLTATDAHTLQSPTGGITYIPIPEGSGPNYAGLFSVQLPPGIKRGQEFKIVVRQITSKFENEASPVQINDNAAVAPPRTVLRRRYVYGSFQISIPVSIKSEMLVPAERNLSVLRWIQQSIPTASRWYPVFQRYINQLSDGVTALGSNGSKVPPTQIGIWPGLPGAGKGSGIGKGPGHFAHDHWSLTGKVDGIVYDHFGDFEAFIVETFEGECRRFDSHEPGVHKLVHLAWKNRTLITVVVRHDRSERPIEIILHGAPPPFEE